MSIASIGSLADRIQGRIDDIPTSISGAVLIEMVDERRIFVEQYTGDSIGSTAIAEKYQPAIISFTITDLLQNMMLVGGDFSSATLGDFSINKGQGGNLSDAAGMWERKGIKQLKVLGKKSPFRQVLG